MNSPIEDNHAMHAGGEVDETLRIIASLPAPDGLEDRVNQALSDAPRLARVLPWPQPRDRWVESAFARGAAAAAIVFVVGGGSWGVYSRVHQSDVPRAIVMPRVAAPGSGFSSAGAMRTPQTLNGPLLAHPVVPPKVISPNVSEIVPSQKQPHSSKKTHKPTKAAPTAQSAQ